VGLRGPGERQLELDRREIRTRIAKLKEDLELVRRQRGEHRRKRKREGIPVVSIVGYTNAGKSTLLNALTGAGVLVADQLFATLDPTTRRVPLPKGETVLFTDTVGFIEKLPTQLVAAFRATLEEINDSNVLVHIVDITHLNAWDQVRAVERTLEEIGVEDKPVVMALNKIDRIELHKGTVDLEEWREEFPNAVPISAQSKSGLDELLGQVERTLGLDLVPVTVKIPFAASELVDLFHRRGMIEKEEYQEGGTRIEGRLPSAVVPQFEKHRVTG
jgi:GTP-binding protein HflX